MIRSLFVSLQEINKGARRPAAVPRKTFKKIGVLGAGFMGGGIAYVSALAGLDVVLVDRDPETAAKGKAHSQALMDEQVKRGRANAAERDALLARIEPTADYVALKDCDLDHRGGVRRPQGQGRGDRSSAECHRQSKPSSAPTPRPCRSHSLAAAFKDRTRFIGIHFFSPVERMNLVEIILGKDTGEAALAGALDYVRTIRKTPIVVNDSRGFYTSRVVGTYLREGHLMLSDGVPAAMIENVGRMAGMPVGPLALNDEVAVDLAWKILQGDRSRSRRRRDRRAAEGAARGDGGKAWPASAARTARASTIIRKRARSGCGRALPICSRTSSIPTRSMSLNSRQRLLAIQALETARCIEEGVVTDMREADVGSILGFGFAPFTGGTISYIDGMGAKAFVALCSRLGETQWGPLQAV